MVVMYMHLVKFSNLEIAILYIIANIKHIKQHYIIILLPNIS